MVELLTAFSNAVLVNRPAFETIVDESFLEVNPNAINAFIEYLAHSWVIAKVSQGLGFLELLHGVCVSILRTWMSSGYCAQCVNEC